MILYDFCLLPAQFFNTLQSINAPIIGCQSADRSGRWIGGVILHFSGLRAHLTSVLCGVQLGSSQLK
jgi:hypothetical protein